MGGDALQIAGTHTATTAMAYLSDIIRGFLNARKAYPNGWCAAGIRVTAQGPDQRPCSNSSIPEPDASRQNGLATHFPSLRPLCPLFRPASIPLVCIYVLQTHAATRYGCSLRAFLVRALFSTVPNARATCRQ